MPARERNHVTDPQRHSLEWYQGSGRLCCFRRDQALSWHIHVIPLRVDKQQQPHRLARLVQQPKRGKEIGLGAQCGHDDAAATSTATRKNQTCRRDKQGGGGSLDIVSLKEKTMKESTIHMTDKAVAKKQSQGNPTALHPQKGQPTKQSTRRGTKGEQLPYGTDRRPHQLPSGSDDKGRTHSRHPDCPSPHRQSI